MTTTRGVSSKCCSLQICWKRIQIGAAAARVLGCAGGLELRRRRLGFWSASRGFFRVEVQRRRLEFLSSSRWLHVRRDRRGSGPGEDRGELFGFNTNTVEYLEKIGENYEFGFNTNTVDLRGIAAERYGRAELNCVGLRTLIGVVLERDGEPEGGYDEQMGQSVADAGSGQYACVDAFVCFEINRILDASSF
ncbi:F-box/RNI-like/FBD-like domains-containing protein [Striga asiatica]|uniref:F-box/RNI-like/FBD-like domains-containing protein n=1 Tax=Striga asiatica TaxID=4170 RepID=A0A5A7PWC8_STRAF|nr:F-box/RNI-like/FBD-like domains-containing protein [Striga asiatica]